MSLLLAEGHPSARKYVLGFMWSEARIVRQRTNSKIVLDAAIMQAVVATALGGKKAQGNLNKLLKKVEDSD